VLSVLVDIGCGCEMKRWQAKERMTRLEESITQAQNREGQILDMTQWMTEMNDLLQSRLDADLVAGDVPDEYEVASSVSSVFL